VVGRGHHHHVAGKVVDLHEQRAHQPLDLARLVQISALLADGVELVEEEDALACPRVAKHLPEALGGLTEIAAHQALVADHEEWDHEIVREGLGHRGLAGARRTDEQHTVPRQALARRTRRLLRDAEQTATPGAAVTDPRPAAR
jgi:hypothetical protein